ncbi:MAG: hypothetical protein AB8G18_12335 [Gammaproteobacteria bacterium]
MIDTHLSLLRDITSGNYQEQDKLFAGVVAQRQQDATAHNRLSEALLLIATGHPNTDRGRGYSKLTALLSSEEELTELERHLAKIVLKETENVMILEARNAELSNTLSDSQLSLDKRGNSDRRSLNQARKDLEAAQQEIDSLEVELTEARAKLEAIKRIEVTSE